MLSVRNLSHSFNYEGTLKNVSFALKKGDFLFLAGPSGAGKTTLLRILYGSLAVQRGQVDIAGFHLNALDEKKIPFLRRQVSVVFQDFKILADRTVFENVAMALEVRGVPRNVIDRRVRAVCRGLGLERRLDVPSMHLSGGEQQRVAVARAVVVNPQILLADEPTGNLDPELSRRLMDLFMQFNAHGTTVVLATHNRELAARNPSAKMLRLEKGIVTYANWPEATIFNSVDRHDDDGESPLNF